MDVAVGVGFVVLVAVAWLALRGRSSPALDVSNLFPTGATNGTQTPSPAAPEQVGPVPQDAPQAQATLVSWQTPAAGLAYQGSFDSATVVYGLPVGLLARMAWQESRFDPQARSQAGAIGIMQFMPSTAQDFSIDPTDPQASIDAAGKYMAQLYRRFGDWRTALAAYNWGQGNVAAMGMLDEYPPETATYVANIAADLGL
jgi:soluble lytic murein transglycosylase-like protein